MREEHGYGLVSDSSQVGKKHPTFLHDSVLEVNESLGDFTSMKIGDDTVEFHHARGETDDHLWAFFPDRKWIATGDFIIWNFPNAGNPQKVQRWPIEWAAALRRMITQQPELLLPAHGWPIEGKDRIARVLDEIATALENLVREEHGYGLVSDSSQVGKKHPTFLHESVLEVNESLGDFTSMKIGDDTVEFHHARGETDDHLWAFFPDRKWIATGDFIIWNFPNAGNPQKVQRWPIEWAAALRRMITQQPELLLPAHGLPIEGKDRIARVLDEIATALENLVREVLQMMNAGETLDTIIHAVKVPDATLGRPYLRPMYDEPEFIVHNVWRQFGGWWDGAASRLKPAPDAAVGAEVAALAGGADVLVRRAQKLAEEGDLRLACHLADFAGWAVPDDPEVHGIRAEIYERRRKAELSLMAKGIFAAASKE
ncbi:MAG: alkyl sulfatase dimerization domain-containing protein, partial [Actinomycetota bacterium]